MENVEKYLRLAREAREDGHAEEAKKYYDMLRTEDPENGEAKFFYSYYKLMSGKQGEAYSSFYDFAKVIDKSVQRIVALDEEEAVPVLNAMLSAIMTAPDTVTRCLMNIGGDNGKQLHDIALDGIAILFDFGNYIEKFSSNEAMLSVGVLAWKRGVDKLHRFIGIGADKGRIEIYARKINKYDPEYQAPVKKGLLNAILSKFSKK